MLGDAGVLEAGDGAVPDCVPTAGGTAIDDDLLVVTGGADPEVGPDLVDRDAGLAALATLMTPSFSGTSRT